jgi:hypothetical protein
MNRRVSVWLLVVMLVGGPLAFALPYVLPTELSRIEHGLANAALWLVMAGVSELISRRVSRRSSSKRDAEET